MILESLPTLAAIEDFIVPIIAVAMVISGIVNSNREAKKAKEARARRREQRGASDSASVDTSQNLPTLEEIAEQRRKQLDNLSRGRSSSRRSATPEQSSREQVARERQSAKAEYDARAEALRKEQAQEAKRRRAAEQQRRQADELRQREAQVKQERAARARQKQARQQARNQPAQPVQANRSLGVLKGSHINELGSGATEVDTGHIEDGRVHRHVPDVAPIAVKQIGHASEIREMVKGHALRNAIILKEVLDPPLGMRGENHLVDPFSL